jgi:hypothetical protein
MKVKHDNGRTKWVEPSEDGDGYVEWTLTDSFTIHKALWDVIVDLREQADSDERRAVGVAMTSDTETPLPHEMRVTLTVDALRAVAHRLEQVGRTIIESPPSATAESIGAQQK